MEVFPTRAIHHLMWLIAQHYLDAVRCIQNRRVTREICQACQTQNSFVTSLSQAASTSILRGETYRELWWKSCPSRLQKSGTRATPPPRRMGENSKGKASQQKTRERESRYSWMWVTPKPVKGRERICSEWKKFNGSRFALTAARLAGTWWTATAVNHGIVWNKKSQEQI